ncbi:sulfite exporter TauE/SafE family protein [Microvirga brassicacearum]|uniref:Probable membrane transporter protein n=1 Tax=Microvirga brassicacearum TaxID=2580413 RepID=A0A5N3PHF6_9HYPH|nr:sulfite exporter TauE/SafE family protein [Microvirga brassicacearum]KAB0269085.1 sulfite exporter TauE/SafE family protein [Microvirga brassicacearum]
MNLPVPVELLLAACLCLGAMLYTSVGHAGASAYIATMALFGVAPAVMRPTALVLNILVASLTTFRYMKADLFHWRTLWPVLIGAIPMAFVGGSIQLPGHYYRPLVGVILLIAAARLLWPGMTKIAKDTRDIPIGWGIVSGVGIGLLSGLTGTGGGIFLSPLLLFMGWSETRTASGVAAAFILCNSVAGLLGNIASVQSLPAELPLYAGAVLVGALVGTTLGIKLASPAILKALGIVLVIAGLKMLGVY